MRWFLAGYIGCPLLVGFLVAIVFVVTGRSIAGLLMLAPGVMIACLVAPLGLLVGVLCASPGWGLWDGRLTYMGLMAGLVILVIAGLRLEDRVPVRDDGAGAPSVPTARVVTGGQAHLFPTSTWNQLIGCSATFPWKQLISPTLLVIAGAGFFCLGCAGFAVVGSRKLVISAASVDVCELAESICRAQERICRIGDDASARACDNAKISCTEARRRCRDCAGTRP
ncbi:MAG TPA: hypothetical protein VHW23_39665 [Kofleriaceae bacterium]|jgi:hypothetical protein|nr:hypothetical protein [Kofleriaceae bacterium]